MSSVKPGSTVLVRGADGFFGSHLMEELVRKAFKVRAFVHHNSFKSWSWLDQGSEDVKGQFEIFAGNTGFLRGLAETIEWFIQPKNLSFYKENIYNV